MAGIPPIVKPTYNQQLDGVYGEFGSGAGTRAFYLQSALAPQELNQVSLISDVNGSERWPVRDLFQREVDSERVTESLLPYLQDAEKIKFFNPLTLTVLPMAEDHSTVLTSMPRVTESTSLDNEREWRCLERQDFYRVRWPTDAPQYATLEWNDRRSLLVAIDGQHRLSALRRFLVDHKSGAHGSFMSWRIPVVVVSFRADEGRPEPPSVLEVVRSIFVYINTEAQEINRARQILLSDESVNAVVTQALLQRSHTNDVAPIDERAMSRLPLLFYDWRGEEKERRAVHAPAAVKSVEEIHDWFSAYIFGEDFSDNQQIALGINPTDSLHAVFHDRKLSHAASRQVRDRAATTLLPALSYLLEGFRPYRSYVQALRELESTYEATEQNDLAHHAFYELRFGSNRAHDSIKGKVREVLDEIKKQIETLKYDHLHEPLDRDVCMRGIMYAFGRLYMKLGQPGWMEYAEWFTPALNSVYARGWIDRREKAPHRSLLRHIIEDHNEAVVNYRLDDVGDSFGAYVALLVLAYGRPRPDEWPALRDELLDVLQSTLKRGYKKELRPQLREQFPNGGKELTDAVNQRAQQRATRHIRRLERELEIIVN